MKKIYYSPKVKFVEIDLDCVLGNVLSNPDTDKPDDVPYEPVTPPIIDDEEGVPT